jgi:carboxymethylenebutenolidase
MDIARPDIKKKRKRHKIVWIAAAVLLAIVAVFVLWPRHQREYVTVTRSGHAIQALVDRPKKMKDKAPVVVLVHEIYGLSDWAEGMADELADKGFIVVAPDLLSGSGPHGGGYSDFPSEGDRVSAISGLDPDGVLADLDAVVDYAKKLPMGNGKIAVVGFSWGGWKSFAFATHRKDLSAVFVFYGTAPNDVTNITAPIYGFYGGADGGVTGSVSATADQMKAAAKFYEPVTYEDADHGFMRVGEQVLNTNFANKRARKQAFARLVTLLRGMESTQRTPYE